MNDELLGMLEKMYEEQAKKWVHYDTKNYKDKLYNFWIA